MTTTLKYEDYMAEENLILTVSEGETYTSKLSEVFSVQARYAEDIDGYINATLSTSDDRTITFNVTGGTDKKVYVTIKGRL